MAKEKKFADLSAVAEKVLEFLKENDNVLFSDIKKAIPEANPSQLTALVKRGLVSAESVEVEVLKPVKSKVNKYFIKD